MGNKRGFKEKANELKSVGAPLCARVVTLGMGKYFAVLGLHQGTTSEERGVTRVSPSNPRPRVKLSRNIPEIQETRNLRKGSVKKLRRRKWSSYRRIWWITQFSSGSFFFRGLSFSENHLRISFRCR